MGGIFPKELALVTLELGYTEYHQNMPITSSKICLSISIFSPVRFFPHFCAFRQKTEPNRGTFEPQINGTVHKFANIQTAFDILSTLVLRDNSKWRANKSEHGKVDNNHPNFRSKSNKSWEKNIFDRMAEQIELVITQVSRESKLWTHPNLLRQSFSLTFSFKFTYFCIVDILNFFKENNKPLQPLKLPHNIKICHKFT